MTTKLKNLTLFILLLSSLFFSVKSVEGIDYSKTGETSVTKTNVQDTQQFRLDFEQAGGIPRGLGYIHVELTKTSGDKTPILYFASQDDNCKEGRQQFAKSPNSDYVDLWVKIEEFDPDGDLFICVENLQTTSYKLQFTGTDLIDVTENFSYSYLVGSGNKNMVFSPTVVAESDAVTFYAVGSKTVTLSVDGAGKAYSFGLGSAITMKPITEINSSVYSISVSASEGDYVTVGLVNVKDTKSEGGLLQPNGGEISGYLLKDYLEDQCFEITGMNDLYKTQTLYITGRLYDHIGSVYIRDSSFGETEETLVTDGYYTKVLKSSGKINYLCVRFPKENYESLKNIPFTFSVVEPTLSDKYNYYTPLVFGQIYRKLVPKGKIQSFGSLVAPSGKRVTLNVKARSGFPKMYTAKCTDYPFCNSIESNLKDLKEPKKLNRMYTYSYSELVNEKAISSEKTVIIVKCLDVEDESNEYCDFDVSFVATSNEVELVENDTLGQYAAKKDTGTYKIYLAGDTNIRTVNIDVMVLSGDINFSIKSGTTTLNYFKYYLSNKMYFKISTQDNDDITEISLEYTAALNSYYTVKWNANRKNDGATQYRDYITSGSSYLIDMDPTSTIKTKTIKIQNLRYNEKKPFLANFFALNCQFKLTREQNEISFYDGYAQEILTTSSTKYESEYYDYILSITEPDLSNYNHKMCMIYVAGYETSTTTLESEIVMSENINQQFIFNADFKTIRFLYPNPDITKDLALKLNVIDMAQYKVVVYAESKQIITTTLSNTQIIYIESSKYDRYCNENGVCAITVEVTLTDSSLINTDPMAEITLRPILNTPTYLQKGQAKKDFICGEKLYYLYTDIGKNEEGEILVDFMRGNGNIYAKVARKDKTEVDEEANWRDIYRMPSGDWDDSLAYDAYLKKLKVKTEDTADCIEGCYLLISIQLQVTTEYVKDSQFFPFSILTRVTPANRAYTDIPKVVIQVNEYIIGNVDVADNERIYEFYEVWLPHDSEQVEFDFQSEVAGLYINLGGTRPTTKNADFKLLPTGTHSVLLLYKSEILDRAKAKGISVPIPGEIQDVNLVIGVWTDKTDSVGTELYSLRIHQPLENAIDVVEVNSNQKILCRPEMIEDSQYRCLFMVLYDSVQEINNILVYGGSNNKSAKNYMYARFIDKSFYDEYSPDDLKSNVPTNENAEFNSRTDGVEYIYTGKAEQGKYLYVSIVTDRQDDVMFLSSLGSYDFNVFANPSSAQILSAKKGQELALRFQVKQDMIASIISLAGEAEIAWVTLNGKQNVYNLKGDGDRLTITSGKIFSEAKSDTEMESIYLSVRCPDESNAMTDPGFVFYVFYHLRNSEVNFDEVYSGRSLLLAYRDSDLPVFLYDKIQNSQSDVNIALKFIDKTQNDEGTSNFKSTPFKLNAALVKESIAYLAKANPELKPSYEKSKVGTYDYAINTAQVSLSEADLASFNIRNSDNPTLYFGLDKDYQYLYVYDKFNIEASVMIVNNGISPLDGQYHYGKVIKESDQNYFRLKINKNKKLMRIQVALNSAALNFAVSEDQISKNNMTFISSNWENGKTVITLNTPNKEYVNLVFFVNDPDMASDRRLNNYCFKYLFGDSDSDFKEYKIKDNDRNVNYVLKNENGNVTDVTATFKKLDVAEGVNVTYTLKVVPNETHAYRESYETIAVTESPYALVSVKNPTTDNVELTLSEGSNNWVSLQVVAAINDGDNYEYVSYKGSYNLRPYNGPSGGGDTGGVSTSVFVAVGTILLLIVIGLVVAVIIFKNKNKSLLNQVKHVSFQKTNSNVDPNLLLKKQQQGEAPAEGTPATESA